MSIKKLFDSTNNSRNYLSDTNEKDAFQKVESTKNIQQLKTKQNDFVPQVNYSKPENFARYGSAYLYYKGAMERIYDYYPYDGSDAEINKFYNELLDIEKYIFNNLYPRTNGYALLSADGWGSLNGSIDDGYGTPSSLEYITFYGGPHTSSYTKLADAFPSDLNSKRDASNVYDEDIYTSDSLPSDYGTGTRQSNLRSNFDTGVTIEFWLKKAAFDNTKTEKEVIFDMWNNGVSGSATYGRLRVELTGAASGSPFLITAQSASSGFLQQSIGQSLTTASLETFSHYAVTFYNSGSNIITELYVNGALNDTNTTAGSLNELNSKNMTGRIGALLTASVDAGNVYGAAGAGKLSASLDEFRFWKARRNGEDIGLNWKSQVRGGANTDISNTTLGVYYKFNEGVTGENTVDDNVLDYSGRISNGTWTGYDTYSRSTASAFVESGNRTSEYLDPIIYSTHPSVSSLQTSLLNKGENHDFNNNASVVNTLPSWISDDITDRTNDLYLLTHIVGSYLDKLYLQIQAVSQLKFATYTSASAKPLPFAQHLPQSLGLYTPELFIDSNVLEKFFNRTEDIFMESDLNDTKNLIYLNLYNSLTGIFKSKGTERAVRNVLRCFNIDDKVVKLRTYADQNLYVLENNLQTTIKNVSSVNLNKNDNINGVVYQASDASNSDSFAFISGTYSDNKEDRYGFTMEANATFPHFERRDETVNRYNTTVSLFGMTLANTASANDTTWASTDPVNFQVYAIRPEPWSKNVYFKITSSVSPNPFPALTSSLFFDVYNNNQWNFSVRLKPSNFPVTDIVEGSDTFTYTLEFEGINAVNDTIQNSFLLTSSIAQSTGSDFLKSAKRIYAGARRTNITGAVVHSSDVLLTDVKYWTKYLNSNNIRQHLYDSENAGVSGSYRNVSALDTNLNNTDVANLNTLALHWTFDNITGSDSSGNFYYVNDMSSGSAQVRNNYGWIGGISGYQYTGYGFGFEASSTGVVKKELTNVLKFVDPEEPVSTNMVNVFGDTEKLYKRTQTPPDFFHVIEKSMYNAISEEMLLFFAGAVDFNNLIGAPVHRYRERYKDLEKLREIFFRKIPQVSTVEKFINYYKWLDDSIAGIISQLIPAASEFDADIYNVVESHVLERNKYKTQFPTLEFKSQEPDTPILGINELDYNWKFGHAPLTNNQADNTVWWNERANRSDADLTSGDSTVDTQRENIRETADKVNNQKAPVFQTINRATYNGSTDVLRKRARPYKFDVIKNTTIKGGVNFEPAKNIHLTYNALYPAGPVNVENDVYVPENVLFAPTVDLQDISPISNDVEDPNKKTKRYFWVQHGRDWEEGFGYSNVKSSFIFPFNVFSSSVTTGYNAEVVAKVSGNLQITNVHNDVYGPDMEVPMQGPFTDYAVGGHQSRHIRINQGSDNYLNRPEAWKILLDTCEGYAGVSGAIGMVGADYPYPEANAVNATPYPMTGAQKAVYYRDHIAKRPVNIRNILMRTGSTILGNYSNNYEVVSTVGGYSNPRAFIDNQPTLPTQITQTPSASQARSILDIRRTDQNHFEFVPDYAVNYLHDNANNKSVIRSRFSAPGSVEVLGQGYGDIRSNDFSVYNSINYRNLTVRRPFQHISGTVSEATGSGTTGIRVSDQNGNDFGLVRNLSAHAGKFGRDNTVTNPGASYEQAAAFIKVNRNPIRKIIENSNGTFTTSSKFDNFYVKHPIPRSDRQYAWITGALNQAALNNFIRYGGYAPVSGPQAGYYTVSSSTGREYVAFFDFVSASDAKVGDLYQPAMGLNIYVDETVDALADNNLGLPLNANVLGYYNTDLLGPLFPSLNQDSDYFNLLMAKRKNVFGFRGVPETGPVNSAVLRSHRRNNILTITDDAGLNRYTTKVFTNRAKPILTNIFDVAKNTDVTLKATYNNTKIYFSDEDLNQKLNLAAGEVTLFDQLVEMTANTSSFVMNWALYEETLFPSKLNEFTSGSSTRVGYDNLYWRATDSERVQLHSDSIRTNSFGVIVSQSAWPLDAPLGFLTRSASDIPYIGSGLTTLLRLSNSAGEMQNEYMHAHPAASPVPDNIINQNCVVGGLYARKHMLGGPRSVVSPSGMQIPETGSGYALNPNTGDYSASFSDIVKPYTGEALWEAGTQAGIIEKSGSSFAFVSKSSEPWFSNYDDYKEDLLLVSRGYAVVPEFRISEHIEDYEKSGIDSNNKTDTFEIVGTSNNSSDTDFYKDFSNSEFMEGFVRINETTGMDPDEIRLVCSASIRFNPYKGFYPAQRTMDLVKRFEQSYGPGIQGESDGISAPGTAAGSVRPLAQAMFAPGILYNTIKSGMAVDYPIVTSRSKFKKEFFGSNNSASADTAWMITSDSTSSADPIGYQGGLFWDYRIPFEAIIEPEKYIANLNFFDAEPHPSASLNATASLSAINSDNIYTKMASNFFAEVSNFFLADSSYTKLESTVVADDLKFVNGDRFGARLKLRRSMSGSKTYLLESGSSGNNRPFGTYGGKYLDTTGTPSFQNGSVYPIPQNPRMMSKTDLQENFTLYSRPTGFGPAVAGRPAGDKAVSSSILLTNPADSVNGINPAYTPPYYDGEAWIDFVFDPTPGVSYDLQRILSEVKTKCWRFDPGPSASAAPIGSTTNYVGTQFIPTFSGNVAGQGDMIYDGKNINFNSMHVTHSLSCFGVERVEKTRTDAFNNQILTENETAGSKWIIQPKMETPHVNFNNLGAHPITNADSTLSLPTYSSASVPRGMWHQFGVIEPDPAVGIFMEIGEIPNEWLKYHYDVVTVDSVYNNFDASNSGSSVHTTMKPLTDVVKFNQSSKKMGQFSERVVLKEAIVAIPYTNNVATSATTTYSYQQKQFFGIDRSKIDACLDSAVNSADGDSLEAAGESIRNLVAVMQEYVLPPQFDFINNRSIDPMAMYFFEFEYELDRDDLSYIWQNLAPRNYETITKDSVSVAHKLGDNELLSKDEFMSENTRWMVFKVKQRSQKEYSETTVAQVGESDPFNLGTTATSEAYPVKFNWPYDYVSFVESIKIDGAGLYKRESTNTTDTE